MTVEPIIDVDTLYQDASISETDLDSSFRGQAAIFAYYASLHFKAMQQASRKKILLDLTESKLDKEIRDQAAEEGKKATEKQIEQEISRTPSYVAAVKDYNEAGAILDLVKNALEALKQKRDMLIQLGATAREERKGELTMMAAGARQAASREETLEKMRGVMEKA